MTTDTSRRVFLRSTGAAVLGLGCGVPLVHAIASEIFDATPKGPRWALVVDTKGCEAEGECDACALACHKAHNVPSIDDPKEEVKWAWKESFEDVFHGQAHEHLKADVKERDVLVLCNHCDNPPCVRVCPTQATWKREDGIVMMDMHRCIGCRYCIVGCPYGSRSFNWSDPREHLGSVEGTYPTRTKGVVEKCDFCAEKARDGEGAWTPECVAACPAKALTFGDVNDPDSPVRKLLAENLSSVRKPELGTRPHVFYLV